MSDEAENADRRVGVFVSKADRWQDELAALRSILLDTDLTETFKWRQPVYTWRGANVAILWAFKDNCGLGFFKGALLSDPEGVLEAPGENTRAARKFPFRSAAEVRAGEPIIRAYVAEAIEVERKGLKVDLPKDDLALPDELTQAFAADPDFAAAFEALTPGRRRSWVLHISQAKKPETRVARIEKAEPKIRAGKGWNER
ncbi:MAG: hypothetical protein HKN98_10910 [Silicimonas sp.]|nr:hypothetical protein [Silicimonas sp.]